MDDILSRDPVELREDINKLAAKLARTARLIAQEDTKFYLPPEVNGPLVNHEIPMYWQMAVTAYEHIYGVDIKMVLDDYFSQQPESESACEERICPKTDSPCIHLAACNHLGQCNEPIPISEFVKQSPNNAAMMESVMQDLHSGKISLS